MNFEEEKENRPVVAVWDFDGTITHADSLLPFLRESTMMPAFFFKLISLSPIFIKLKLRRITTQEAKEAVVSAYLKGRSRGEIDSLVRTFLKRRLPMLINKKAMEQLRAHQQRGHKVILLSASMDAYLEPWARNAGIECTLCTNLAWKETRLSGKFSSKNCKGSEKVERLKQALGDFSKWEIYAYGDAPSDLELLSQVDHPFYRSFFLSPRFLNPVKKITCFLRAIF